MDVNDNPIARTEFARRGLQGVPAFVIGDQVVVGLDKGRIEALLDYIVVGCKGCSTKLRLPKNKGRIRVTCPSCGEKSEIST